METCVTYSEASEFSGVSVWVSARLNSSRNKAKVEELLVEVAGVSAKISDKVANFGSDRSIVVNDQSFEVIVNGGVMDVFVEIFRNSSQLRDQTQSINNNNWIVLVSKEPVLVDNSEAVCLYELLSKLLAAFGAKYKS